MNPYMFVIDAVPLKENKNYETVAGAKIHIWVIDTDISSAEKRALSYVSKYLWSATKIEHAFAILPQHIDDLGKSELRLYHTALQHGISADFLAWSNDDNSPENVVHIGRP